MQWRELTPPGGVRTIAVVFDAGDEVMAGLRRVAEAEGITGAGLTGIGALSEATVAWFDWEAKDYREIPLAEQVEVLTLAGDVATRDGEPQVHAHVVLGKRDGTAHGGHLVSARVRPTLEVVMTETPAEMRKEVDEASGLALISLAASSGPTGP